MSDDDWHPQAIREANLLSYEAVSDGDKIKIPHYDAMDRKEFLSWLEQARYVAGHDK